MNAGGDGDDLSQRGKLIVPKLFPFGGMGGGETGGGIGREENDRIGGNLAQAMLDEEPAQRIPRTLQQVGERFGIDDAWIRGSGAERRETCLYARLFAWTSGCVDVWLRVSFCACVCVRASVRACIGLISPSNSFTLSPVGSE